MDLVQKEKTITKRSDWCKALSHYSSDQKICGGCLLAKEGLTDYYLPVEKAADKLVGINLQKFALSLNDSGKAVFISSSKKRISDHFLIYLEKEAVFDQVFKLIIKEKRSAKPYATVISPDYYSKGKRAEEKQLVKQIQQYFDPTGFIKLPLMDISEIIDFSESESCETLILPYSKLPEYLQRILDQPDRSILPALFYKSSLS